MLNKENVFRNTGPQRRSESANLSKFQTRINDYFAQPSVETITTSKNYQTMFQNLRIENEKMTQYQDRLLSIHKELGSLNRETYSDTIQNAMRAARGTKPTDIIVPVSKLDPLISAYEEKLAILTDEVN